MKVLPGGSRTLKNVNGRKNKGLTKPGKEERKEKKMRGEKGRLGEKNKG